MITIEQPEIQINSNNSVTISTIFEIDSLQQKLWFKLPAEYKDYLVTENLDAFLVALLPLGLKNGMDIQLNGSVSAKLIYNLNHYCIPALSFAYWGFNKIKITAKDKNESSLNNGEVAATGLSCGVDSFSTYFDHINETGSYKIKHLTFFNVGSHGKGGENTRKIFKERLTRVQKFADDENLPIISIDSNLSEILNLEFHPTNTLRNISCVLLLQKLIKNYYLASKNRIDFIKIPSYEAQDYDSLIVNMLSTESTSFYSSVAQFTRVERTNLLSNYSETFNHLDVCIQPRNKGEKINCSRCNKCLRTALTLDLLGKLEDYQNVFDINIYKKHKTDFIWYLITHKNKDQITSDLYSLLKKSGEINVSEVFLHKFKNQLKKIRKIIPKK